MKFDRLIFLTTAAVLLSPEASLAQFSPNGADSTSAESKYSLKRSVSRGMSKQIDSLASIDPSLIGQSEYSAIDWRWKFIDHFIDNQTPEHIPLNSWKNDFIAGELALDASDFPEAARSFTMALSQSTKESGPDKKLHEALAQARLAWLDTQEGKFDQALELYNKALPILYLDKQGNAKAIDVSLKNLAVQYWQQKRFSEAEKYLQQRIDLIGQTSGTMSSPYSPALNDLANCLYYQKKFAEADKLYLKALTICQRNPRHARYLIYAAYNLAGCRFEQKRFADALALFSQAKRVSAREPRIAVCESKIATIADKTTKNLPPAVGDSQVLKELLQSARLTAATGNIGESRELLDAATLEAQGMSANPASEATVNMCRGDLYLQQGDMRQASAYYQSAADLAQNKMQDKAFNVEKRSILTHSLSCAIVAQIADHKSSEAEKNLKALNIIATSETWINLIPTISDLFEKRRFFRNGEEKLSVLEQVCATCVKTVQAHNDMNRALAVCNLARTHALENNQEKAEPLFTQAISIAQKAKDKDDRRLFYMNISAGLTHMQAQNFSQAESCFNSALALARKDPGKNSTNILTALQYMQSLYNNWHKPDEEEKYILELADMKGGQTDRQSSRRAQRNERNTLMNLSRVAQEKGDLDKAADYLEQVLNLPDGSGRSDSSVISLLTQIYGENGNWTKQAAVYERALKGEADPSSQGARVKQYSFAVAALKAGQYERAQKTLETLVADMENSKQDRDKFYGCYYSEPRYTLCILALGNSLMDGAANYDKAVTVYQKAIKAQADMSAGTLERDRATVGPGCSPGLNQSVAPLTTEFLANMVICYDAIGNSSKANEYRVPLKSRITQAVEVHSRANDGKRSPSYQPAMSLLDKTKRTREEELNLMELVAKCLNDPKVYSGTADGIELLERVIAWKTSKHGTNDARVFPDYNDVVEIYQSNRRFDLAKPYAILRMQMLVRSHQSQELIVSAKLDLADIQRERGELTTAIKNYLEALPAIEHSVASKSVQLLTNLAYCYQRQQDFPKAITYLNQALSSTTKGSAERNDINIRLGTIYDITGDKLKALSYYKSVVLDPTKDNYNTWEPLRTAADWQAELKHYVIADALYRRMADLLGKDPKNIVARSNAYSQLARMYRWARRYDESKAGYELAIACLKSNPGDSFSKSQIEVLEKEMRDMLASAK